ncbi:MAG: hypothetical protein ACC641_01885 [Acidiferrobacterales bacterium]
MTTPDVAEDSAWAAVNTPLSVEHLTKFCGDVERLFRINPMLDFTSFESLGNNRYAMCGQNISQEPPFEFDVAFKVTKLNDGLKIDYEDGIKSSTSIKIEPSEFGSKITLTDAYERLTVDQREQRMGEVDKSLNTWANYLQRFLIMWKRWRYIPPWRWYMHYVWQPMKPMGRRITYILLWVTVAEIALISLGVAIWFAEFR